MAINLNVNGNTAPLEAAVQAAVTRIRKTPIKITVDDKGATQPLGNMKRGADEFSKSMEAANARIIAFGASMAIINGVSDAFKVMVKNMVEVEKSLADINVVMGLSAQNLDKFGDGLFKVAKETGAAFKIAADAATEYARQGLSVEESLKRTKDALILTRLTGMDSAAAVKALTAAMNTYGDQIKDTTQLVSKFAAVDVKFAVSAEDFADAISRTGQAAKSAGVDINELVGLVTAAQQKTARGGKVIGNSFKTIFTRIGRTDTLNQLEDLGIAVRDLEGNTIGAKRILTDLANTFDTLTAAQQAQIAQTVGGVFQINVLKAVLSDAAKQNGILASATQISAGATDEAIQKNEQLRNTMSAMATETGLALKQVSSQIGEIMLAPGMEKVLNIVKSAAEGLGGLLGSGEGAGSTFAQGFLKGLGNIITGPGLVMMVAVFGKLLVKAAQYAHESLKSLIGVTSEAQKQKSIQTSLVNLFSQSSALSKEMLRTDISRTEKEKIILSLLKAQVLEANALNSISKQAASTLYKQGYGSNLAPRRGRAGGHIPNFANPERTQAAQGGYAAGSIRSMKMPGEGSVIYNSAETVKNFAGFKQPAIMPPHSSKAGKNYQQAFGDVHGFDPYAAGGYIPNYARVKDVPNTYMDVGAFKKFAEIRTGTSSSNTKATGAYNALRQYAETNKLQNLSPAALVKSYKESQALKSPKKSLAAMLVPPEGYSGKPFASYSDLTWPVYSLRPDAQTDPSLSKMVEGDFKSTGSKYASKISKVLERGPVSRDKIWKTMQSDTAGGAKGAWKAAVGALFEAAVNSALDYSASKRGKDEGDFDVRGGDLGLLSKAFDGFPDGMTLADYKSDDRSSGNKASFRKKVLKQAKFNKSQQQNKLKPKGYASGFIPNFANPLSDAIGREKEAGVPVSQIRVGSHPALMNKSNPIGLGVTNTQDEPNGLRDVFGANGFVPNYAQDYFQTSDIESSAGNRKERNRLMLKLNKELKQELKQLPKGRKGQEKLAQIVTSLGQKYKANESAVQRVTQANRTLRTKLTQSVKGMGSGMGGMGLMMGLPMLAGFIPGAEKPGSGGSLMSGALTGAATGAGIGMMFPGFGTAIGAAVGALGGLVSSLEQSTNTIQEESEQRAKSFASFLPLGDMVNELSGPGGAGGMTAGKFLGDNSNLLEKKTDVLNVATGEITNQQSIVKKTNPMLNKTVKDVLSQTLPSVPASFEEFRQISKTLPSGQKKIDESQIIYGGGRDLDEALRNRVQSAQADLSKYNVDVKNTGGTQREIIFNLLDSMSSTVDMFPDLMKGENGSISFSEESKSMQTYGQFAQKIAGMLEGEQGLENLDKVTKLLVQKMDESFVAQSKQNEATILQINSQKISLDSQNKFNKQIKRATSSQAEMNNQYASMMKVRADFMTKEEKFNAAYLNAIENAEKERKKSNIKAEQGIAGDVLKTLMSTDYQQSFKDYLKDTNDLSGEKFSKTNLKERRKILEIVGEKSKFRRKNYVNSSISKSSID
jgi:TP901 family phage tail tape measure protein